MNKLAEQIIRTIWTRSEGTYVFLPHATYRGPWFEGPAIRKDTDMLPFDTTLDLDPLDSYFSVLSFDAPVRKGDNVSGNIGVMWLDLDNIPEDSPPILYLRDQVGFDPAYLWRTSPGHYQAVWFTTPLPKDQWRPLAKAFTDRIEGADPGGWSETKVLRVPGSINYKRGGMPGHILRLPYGQPVPDPYELAYGRGTIVGKTRGQLSDLAHSLPPAPISSDDRLRLLLREWHRLPLGVQHWLTVSEGSYQYFAPRDRSLLIRGLIVQMKEAGLDAPTTFHLIQGRPFDKFRDRPQALWDEVRRAHPATAHTGGGSAESLSL